MNNGTPKRRLRAEDLGRLELRIVGCIGRASGYLSISELAREVGADRRLVKDLLYGLVATGVLEETGREINRPSYRLVGISLDEIEAAEERPTLADLYDFNAPGRPGGNPKRDPEAPTENEEKVLEFLRHPATQDEIAEKFGYGRSRKSEVVRALISKGLIRKCGTAKYRDYYIRTEVSDEEVKALLLDLHKDEREAARRREEIIFELITRPMSINQIAECTGLTAPEVRKAAETLVTQGKAVSFGSMGGQRFARVDAPDAMAKTALKWKGTRFNRAELEILNYLEGVSTPVTGMEVSRGVGRHFVGVYAILRKFVSMGIVHREEDVRKSRVLLFSLRPGHTSAR